MRIRAIELTNIRRFAGHTARIEGMGDGITVLCEPNEFGKSTFFDALHALFFERHRGTRAGVKALQPHAGGAPEVALDIDLPQGRFRIEKRWLSRPTARIRQDGRIVAQDDEAEAWIDAIMGRGLSAPSGLLWVRQGLLGMEPEGSSASDRTERERVLGARRDLVSSVAGEIAMMTGGRRLDAVVARVEDALGRLATTTGRAKAGGEWARAEAEAEALRTQEADLTAKASRLSGELARRAEVHCVQARGCPRRPGCRSAAFRHPESCATGAQPGSDPSARPRPSPRAPSPFDRHSETVSKPRASTSASQPIATEAFISRAPSRWVPRPCLRASRVAASR